MSAPATVPTPTTESAPTSARRARANLGGRRRTRPGLVLISLLAVTLLSGCTPGIMAAGMVNGERRDRGIHELTWDDALAAKAQAWAEKMAADGKLSHSTLSDNQQPGWTALAENVAQNSSVEGAHQAFMNSSGHRTNILSSTYTKIGVGVVESGGYVWVVQEFRAG